MSKELAESGKALKRLMRFARRQAGLPEDEPPEIDYRDLLKRYIAHVAHEEGTDFLGWLDEEVFSAAEVAELDAISTELGHHRDFPL